MAQEFDDALEELEQSVIEDMQRTSSEKVIDHFLNPRNLGKIEAPDGFGRITNSCGDTMELYLKVKDNRVMNASFRIDGCGTTIAAGSMVTELVKGKSIIEAQGITQYDILNALDGLSDDSLDCTLLAADTLKEAIKDYLAFENEPWKMVYRSC
jgi:nitrogen fixation NifU-like protein